MNRAREAGGPKSDDSNRGYGWAGGVGSGMASREADGSKLVARAEAASVAAGGRRTSLLVCWMTLCR